ncbi:putative DUF21 domain-containing protein, chloroplastic [Salvia divinorum]|uniref:DUF21 domain-containing protein, chloroplastic n=1 Tax=Salvia divinorum TaxID=28513 RepID=A0ABD1FQG7_SALDI
MGAAATASQTKVFNRSAFVSGYYPSFILRPRSLLRLSPKLSAKKLACCSCSNERSPLSLISFQISSHANIDTNTPASRAIDFDEVLVRRGLAAAAIAAVVILVCRRALAAEGVVAAGYGAWERSLSSIRSSWPMVLQVLMVFKEQGLILAALLGLSAFFSMAETSITTLWPWKVRELAEKESENGVFKMLRNDVTRFLTTILIGTTYFMC